MTSPDTTPAGQSPAERYASYRERTAGSGPALLDFRTLYDFDLDPFQIEACKALEGGSGVLVAAPTGSGKTVVGEFAVHLALTAAPSASTPRRSRRCRTRSTPISSAATGPRRSGCSPATTASTARPRSW